MLPGNSKIYSSFDEIITDDIRERDNYPVEFLNTLSVSGMPPHKLELKINCIVLLIRNLDTNKSLVNGTRMRIKQMYKNLLDCEVLTGNSKNARILIPRAHLTYSGSLLPFKFKRVQFPIICAFAMTINKSQGQTYQNVAILLRQPVFSHGQLYVAASRVRSFEGLRFYIMNTEEQGNLLHDGRIFTKNIVYKEIIKD
ncbi:ATP-dependent DNA helicase PIF1-like [Haematobia irritans]|uniref:ATP-dependent DNA helicase PIF1-like n=1 Tax=Haematobia irritans TaxID=7368 RepID=UPI003F4F6751